jgi:hypothetical protein
VVFKEEILKVSNEYVFTPFTSYVKKDTLFTEDSSDDDSNNEKKGDDIPSNLTKFGNEYEDNNSKMFTQNGINIIEWTSPTTWKPLHTLNTTIAAANNAVQPRHTVEDRNTAALNTMVTPTVPTPLVH